MRHQNRKPKGKKHRKHMRKKVVKGLLAAATLGAAIGTGYVCSQPAPAPASSCVELHVPFLRQV